MRLNQGKFNTYEGRVENARTGDCEQATFYTYESIARIYDVMVIESVKYYRVNGGAWSNLITNIMPIHYEIERHFGI